MSCGQPPCNIGERVRQTFLNSLLLFNADKVLTLPLSALNMAGFSLSCSNKPLNSFPSIVMSK